MLTRMSMRERLMSVVAVLVMLAGVPRRAESQVASIASPPQIVTSATGESTLVPDRGMIFFAVENRANTAVGAGAANARIQSAVIAALRARGVAAAHVTTAGYSIGPEERFDDGQRKVTGYIARNSVVVDVQNIEQVGALIDAALGAGANSIGGLRYYSTNFEVIRRSALESAVAKARADAEVMARAAGGTLGGPIEISANEVGMPRPMYDVMVTSRVLAAGAETPIAVGEQKVSVSVTTRWLFLASR